MSQNIAHVAVLVRDYDEAVAYYTGCLGFTLLEDTVVSEGKRWVLVGPAGSGCSLLLAKARKPEELAAVGRQTGGRVFLFLRTDDFARDYETLLARGVRFCEQPRKEAYGTVAVFEDLYGNRWDLLQLHHSPKKAPATTATPATAVAAPRATPAVGVAHRMPPGETHVRT